MAYKEIKISKLQPGSYVVGVLKQSGDITVTHAGWVRTQQAIDLLRTKGVKTVLIDPEQTLAPAEPEVAQEAPSDTEEVVSKVMFDNELPRAQKAFQQYTGSQKKLFQAVKQDSAVDFTLVNDISAGISASISRNQDVLLCLTKIAEQSDALLQHSLNCAVYMAAFARSLHLPADMIQQLITAALLHDIGKAIKDDGLQLADHKAIPASLQTLQRTTELAEDISLWISQHCAHLDGSGFPPIRQHEIAQGSKMLAIVNQYENLTNPLTGKAGPLAASRTLLEQAPDKLDAELAQQFIKCIGVYPPGSVVRLKTGKLAVVLENNPKKVTQPKVKLFYHSAHQHHIPPKIIDLAKQQDDQIDACVDLKKYGLELKNYL